MDRHELAAKHLGGALKHGVDGAPRVLRVGGQAGRREGEGGREGMKEAVREGGREGGMVSVDGWRVGCRVGGT